MKVIIFVILCIIIFINLVLIKINTNASFYADGLTTINNMNNAMAHCRRNTNNPLDIRQCLLNIMNSSVKLPTHRQIVSQIDNAFNNCKGDQKCMLNAMNSMRR